MTDEWESKDCQCQANPYDEQSDSLDIGRSAGAADVDDALHAIGEFTTLVNNADAKGGFVATVVAFLVAGIIQQGEFISAAFAPMSLASWLKLILLILLLVSVLITVLGIGLTLIPRTPLGGDGGRFSFPVVAGDEWEFKPVGRDVVAAEAWAHARTLAKIVRRKFKGVKISMYSLGFSFLLFCCWTVVTLVVQ